jgi:hypothetical protein
VTVPNIPPSKLEVDAASRLRLRSIVDGIVIGVVERSTGVIHLYEAAATTDIKLGCVAGHAELIRLRLVSGDDALGFSMHVTNGTVRAFYRASILNRDCEDFAIPYAMIFKVIDAVGLPRSPDFRAYPRETVS